MQFFPPRRAGTTSITTDAPAAAALPLRQCSCLTITWARLVAAAPDLRRLWRQAHQADQGAGHFCRHEAWQGTLTHPGLKPQLATLVGWAAAHRDGHDPLLRSSAAYALAYRTIFHALPPCRHCHCGPSAVA